MVIYEVAAKCIAAVPETTFAVEGLRERDDLQRLLADSIRIVAPDTLVIAEEFCEWDESRRRIDLLAIDKNANLVVIELKRTADGGHMELQALRYAAMVSEMTFDRAVEVYAAFRERRHEQGDARAALLHFLGWDEPDEQAFAQDVRIVLVSADFSKELTTAVLWLNTKGLDITCVRMKPYRHESRTLVDVQQLLPLPEAADYQVRVREKERVEAQGREARSLQHRFLERLLARAKERTDLHAHVTAGPKHWVPASAGVRGLAFAYVVLQRSSRVELYVSRGDREANKEIFDKLSSQRASIEDAAGRSFNWDRLEDKDACRVSVQVDSGGYRDDESSWPTIHDEMIDAMIGMERAFRPVLEGMA